VARHSRGLTFLLDTNIVIPAEPTSPDFAECGTRAICALLGLLNSGGHRYFLHPASLRELATDKDPQRRQLRADLCTKYTELPAPPAIGSGITSVLGTAEPTSHDFVDHSLLAALVHNAADYVVSEDLDLLRKASRLGLRERVASVAEALVVVRGLFPERPIPPPHVREIFSHELDGNDPIFNSFRQDYPGFDLWLAKVQREHRHAWRIDTPGAGIAAFTIVKPETESEPRFGGNALKICSIKVSEDSQGFCFGELLLKTVFEHAFANRHDCIYVTVLPKYSELIDLLEGFGFCQQPIVRERGELTLLKRLACEEDESSRLEPLEFHILFGPRCVKSDGAGLFVVPVRPEFHAMLFPEAEVQMSAIARKARFATAIRKAYVCRAPTRQMRPGSLMLFYRSHDLHHVTCVGVAESALRSADPTEVARFVGKRAVYSYRQIEEMCLRPVLATLFRQAWILKRPVALGELKSHGVINAAPQSITRVLPGGRKWLVRRIDESP